MIRFLALATASFCGGVVVLFTLVACSNGIFSTDNNPNVVYLAGEGCVINTTAARPPSALLEDFQYCMELHEHFHAIWVLNHRTPDHLVVGPQLDDLSTTIDTNTIEDN